MHFPGIRQTNAQRPYARHMNVTWQASDVWKSCLQLCAPRGVPSCDLSHVAHDTVKLHFGPQQALNGVRRGQHGSERPKMAHCMPHVGSPVARNSPLARHLSLEGDPTWWAEATKGFGTVLGHFGHSWPVLAHFWGPGAFGGILSSKATTNGIRPGIQTPKCGTRVPTHQVWGLSGVSYGRYGNRTRP